MGYIKGDCFKGIVSDTTAKGVNVTLEGTSDRAFCRCNLNPGDIASFTVLGWRTDVYGTSVLYGYEYDLDRSYQRKRQRF